MTPGAVTEAEHTLESFGVKKAFNWTIANFKSIDEFFFLMKLIWQHASIA